MPLTRWITVLVLTLITAFSALAAVLIAAEPGIDSALTVIIQDSEGAAALYQLTDGDLTHLMPLDIGADGYIEYHSPMAWSPDGEKLLFQAVRAFDLGEIWMVEPGTGAKHTLIRSRTVNMDLSWSAGNDLIVIDNDRSSYIQEVDGGATVLLDEDTLGADVVAVRHAVWSPVEPELMAAVLLRGDGQARLALVQVGETFAIQRVLLTGYAVIDQVAWTPDGRALTYRLTAAPYDSYVTSRYQMMDLLTEDPHPLTEQRIEPARMVWSLDRAKLAMIAAGRQGARLYILDAATDTVQQVYSPGDNALFQHISWSPDGEVLLVGRDEDAACSVMLLDVARDLWVHPFPHDLGPCQVFGAWR